MASGFGPLEQSLFALLLSRNNYGWAGQSPMPFYLSEAHLSVAVKVTSASYSCTRQDSYGS